MPNSPAPNAVMCASLLDYENIWRHVSSQARANKLPTSNAHPRAARRRHNDNCDTCKHTRRAKPVPGQTDVVKKCTYTYVGVITMQNFAKLNSSVRIGDLEKLINPSDSDLQT